MTIPSHPSSAHPPLSKVSRRRLSSALRPPQLHCRGILQLLRDPRRVDSALKRPPCPCRGMHLPLHDSDHEWLHPNQRLLQCRSQETRPLLRANNFRLLRPFRFRLRPPPRRQTTASPPRRKGPKHAPRKPQESRQRPLGKPNEPREGRPRPQERLWRTWCNKARSGVHDLYAIYEYYPFLLHILTTFDHALLFRILAVLRRPIFKNWARGSPLVQIVANRVQDGPADDRRPRILLSTASKLSCHNNMRQLQHHEKKLLKKVDFLDVSPLFVMR